MGNRDNLDIIGPDFVTLIKTVLVTVLTRDHQVYFMGKFKGFLGIVELLVVIERMNLHQTEFQVKSQ